MCWQSRARRPDFLNPLTSYKAHTGPPAPLSMWGSWHTQLQTTFSSKSQLIPGREALILSASGELGGRGVWGTPLLDALWPQPPVSKKPFGSSWKGHFWCQKLEAGIWEGLGWKGLRLLSRHLWTEPPRSGSGRANPISAFWAGRWGAFSLCPMLGGTQKPLPHPHGNFQGQNFRQCCMGGY